MKNKSPLINTENKKLFMKSFVITLGVGGGIIISLSGIALIILLIAGIVTLVGG